MKKKEGNQKMKLKVKYLENGKTKETITNNMREQMELWNRQKDGEISVIEVKKI